jgi:hypothetical protein
MRISKRDDELTWYVCSPHSTCFSLSDMKQTCAYCGKGFPSTKSLDRHGRFCAKKHNRRPPSPSIASTSAAPAEVSRKRARFDDPPSDEYATHQGQEDNNDPGPSDANIREDSPPPTRSRRSGRIIRLPERLQDYVLFGDMSLDHVPLHARESTPPESDDRTATPPPERSPSLDTQPYPHQTKANKVGAFRRYTHHPTWHPRDAERLELISDSPSRNAPESTVDRNVVHEISSTRSGPYAPFNNFTVATYMHAYFDGGTRNPRLTRHP